MAIYCNNCGKELPEGTRFCTECGADVAAGKQPAPEYIDSPAASYQSYAPPQNAQAGDAYQSSGAYTSSYGQQGYAPPTGEAQGTGAGYSQYGQSAPQSAPQEQEAPPHPDSPYAPVKMGAWVGVEFLMMIPVVNLILAIVWACGGSKKINLRNYGRGRLIVMAIQCVISILLFAAFMAFIAEFSYVFDDFFDYFDYMRL